MAHFESRSYSGKLTRPKPEIHFSEEQSLLIVASPWGGSEIAQQAISIATEYFSTAYDDIEITSPFPLQTCLTATENYLRVASLLVNESIYRESNGEEYLNGLEFLALHFNSVECALAQAGQPSCLLSRKGRHLFPLSVQSDLALETQTSLELPPLPSNLLGLDPTVNLSIKSFAPCDGDELFFISRSDLPGRLFTLSEKERTLDRMTEILAQDNENQPFWIGRLQLT